MSDQDNLADDYERHNLGGQQGQQGQGQSQQGQDRQFNPYSQYGFQPGAQSFQPGAQSFQPGAPAFTPGQYGRYYQNYSQPYGQYGGGYQQYGQYGGGGYNRGYQQQQQQQQQNQEQDESTMTLEEFQNKKSFSPTPPGKAGGASGAPKPKTDIRIGGGNAAAASKPKTEIRIGGGGNNSAAASKPKTDIRIGGAPATKPEATEEKKAESPKPTPAEPVKKADPPKSEPAKKEEKKESPASTKNSSASNSRSATPAPAAAAASKMDKAAIQEQEKKLNADTMKDLFGDEQIKEHMSIIFMGHVDAGKSTMSGQCLYLTGAVSERVVNKVKQDAENAGRGNWYLSWIMDVSDEASEGKTKEVAKVPFNTDQRRYSILDAPGHKMYVPQMIGGAAQADVGILVISARKGEFETGFEKAGQTREHTVLGKQAGITRLVVVVNKMDDTTVEWSKERYDECVSKLSAFLKSLSYNLKTDVKFMPVSGYTGAGIKERVSKTDCPWYEGPALLEYLDSLPVSSRDVSGPFMLPVANKGKDLGTFVDGKIECGHVSKGDKNLVLMPVKTSVEVSAIFNESEEEVNAEICGNHVRLRLKGVDSEEDVQTGFVLCSAKEPIHAVTKFAAQVAFIDLPSIVTAGYTCVMHVHTAVAEVTISKLLHKLEKGTGRKSKKPPAFAKKGSLVIADLEAATPVCLETYANLRQLGRFTLRSSEGATIAIGKVVKLRE